MSDTVRKNNKHSIYKHKQIKYNRRSIGMNVLAPRKMKRDGERETVRGERWNGGTKEEE